MVFVTNSISATTIAAGGHADFGPYDLATGQGILGLFLTVSGSGICKVDILGALNGVDYRMGDGKSPVKTGLTATSGDESDGKVLLEGSSDNMPVATSVIVRVTETEEAESVVVSGVVCIR